MSDCATVTSSGGSDLSEVAHAMGLSAHSLTQSRFRVDRRSLEKLMYESEDSNAATQFFETVMRSTNTRINWPLRLKQGAKTKKDPHVKIIGRPEDVEAASAKIQTALDTKGSRVVMKIDVSYTDHSHMIGKEGLTIKRVMDETGCRIHFPDSNRTNETEKSNQVSITGEVAGVEKARARVRELTPLIFCFELPVVEGMCAGGYDPNAPFIEDLQESHNVHIMFRSWQKLYSTLVMVKGVEWEVNQVKEATYLLINRMCGSLANDVAVHIMLDISPHLQSIVYGRNNENLRRIMEQTQTQIMIVDPLDPNIPALKKSRVTITGSINNVYLARQQLIGSLPVVLMFDVPENVLVPDTTFHSELMNKLDIAISVRYKPRHNLISVFIKGIERNVGNVYEARRLLVAPNESQVKPNVPSTYFMANALPVFNLSTRSGERPWIGPVIPGWPCQRFLPLVPLSPAYLNVPSDSQPYPPAQITVTGPLSSNSGSLNSLYSPRVLSPLPQTATSTTKNSEEWWSEGQTNGSGQFHPSPREAQGSQGAVSSKSSSLSSLYSPRVLSPLPQSATSTTRNSGHVSSNSSNSSVYSPRVLSPLPQSATSTSKNSVSENWWQGGPQKTSGSDQQPSQPDYSQLQMQAIQAWQQDIQPSQLRVPNSAWSGYGFSHSSPTCGERQEGDRREDGTTRNPDRAQFCTSDYLESFCGDLSFSHRDLPSLLTDIGLDQYQYLFHMNQVDLGTFRTLSEHDLKVMGVTAFGARRKLAACIAGLQELNRRKRMFQQAPGSERKKPGW